MVAGFFFLLFIVLACRRHPCQASLPATKLYQTRKRESVGTGTVDHVRARLLSLAHLVTPMVPPIPSPKDGLGVRLPAPKDAAVDSRIVAAAVVNKSPCFKDMPLLEALGLESVLGLIVAPEPFTDTSCIIGNQISNNEAVHQTVWNSVFADIGGPPNQWISASASLTATAQRMRICACPHKSGRTLQTDMLRSESCTYTAYVH